MIFVAGAGAMADAARAIRASQRELDRHVSGIMRRRRARAKGRLGVDYEPEVAEWLCGFLCSECDYLVPPQEEEPTEACPCCRSTTWIDLSIEPLAHRIRDMEAEERMKPPPKARRNVYGTAAAVVVIMTVAAGATGGAVAGFITLVAGAMVGTLAGVVAVRPVSLLMLQRQPRSPHRWHLPYPLPPVEATPVKAASGVKAEAVGELVRAPISGRECIAYEVCVLFDTPGDYRPPEWVIQEQGGGDLRLGELEVAAGEYYLESPVEEVEAADVEAVKRFLRERGLFWPDGEYHYYEALLEPGDVVNIAEHEELVIVDHLDPADHGGLPRLPPPTWRP